MKPEVTPPSNIELLETLLTVPGNTMNAYSRFHEYSARNIGWFYAQGIQPQPVGTYAFWQTIGRQVQRGASAKYVLRPITVKQKDQAGEATDKTFTRFKPVKAIFGLDDTDGEPLPPLETPEWSVEQMLAANAIKRVKFELFDGNTAGYSVGRTMAVSDVAPNRLKTACHEVAHIVLGHTLAANHDEYLRHRGRFEFEAEASAYLTVHELGLDTPEQETISRGYVQSWLRGEKPSDESIRNVFRATELMVRSGRVERALGAAALAGSIEVSA